MSGLEDDIRQLRKDMPRIRTYLGTYAGRFDGVPHVDISGESRIAASLGFFEPPIGTAVKVRDYNGDWEITGLADQPPSEGVVSVVGETRATVITDRGEFSVPFMSTYTPSSGHTVQLGFNQQGLHVMGRLSEEVVPNEVPELTNPVATRQVDLFTATASGSAKQGTDLWETNQVYAQEPYVGIYVYGSKVRDTLAAAPPVTKLEVYLPAIVNRYGDMRLGWHDLDTRTGTTPALVRTRTITLNNGWADITDLADLLATGGGIGFYGAGKTIFKGVPIEGKPGDTQAGALRATY